MVAHNYRFCLIKDVGQVLIIGGSGDLRATIQNTSQFKMDLHLFAVIGLTLVDSLLGGSSRTHLSSPFTQ